MKTEFKTLIYSMINNLIISIIKVVGGVIFNLSSLFADGMHTFSDFITDIVCLVGAKLSQKKPTKSHPYGFGKVEYLTNLFVGVVLFLLAVYIIVSSFGKETEIPNISVLLVLLIVFVLKALAIFIMNKVGKKINSQLLITSVKESKADLYSTIGVVIITLLLQLSPQIPMLIYSDIIGTAIIGLIVLKTAISIIIDNSLLLIGEVDNDEAEIDKVEKLLNEWKEVKKYDISLIHYGPYYKLQLSLELNSSLSLREVTKIEDNIKKSIIRHRSLHIKYVSINVTNKI